MAELSKLGRYELRRILGKGAMGVVYEGFDPTLSRRVAVKIILKSVALDPDTERAYAARFIQEAKAVARLNHPNIVQVHDFGVEGDVAYLVMEFIQGRELRNLFDAKETFPPEEAVRIMGQLLDALEFAHEAGVIHRDIKPANVMLDAQRRVKLADFGVARVQEGERSTAGTMVGTPAFMSPEQIQGAKIDRRTDIFSAGVVLYQLLTGEQPFKGEGAWTVAREIMQDDPPPPSSVVLTVATGFDAVVHKALAKTPAQRFATAGEFAAALRGALANALIVPPVVTPKPTTKAEPRASETELEFWRAIQNSGDPAEFEFYLEQFPTGTYSQLARHKIIKLREPFENARKEAEEKTRREVAERTRKEIEERAQREAEEKKKREAERMARFEAEAAARREAEASARRDAEEKARREAAEKSKREADEKVRQAQALARLKQQQETATRPKPVADEDATVAIASAGQAATPPTQRTSLAIPALIGAAVIAAGVVAYSFFGRTPSPAPVPVVEAPPVQRAAPPPALVVDGEKIRRETEERLRKEFAEKAAADRAAMEKVLAEKAAAEKVAAEKLAQAKTAAEKVEGEKAMQKAAAERAAADKAAADQAAQAKAAAERAAVESAAAEKAAAEKAAAEKVAVEKAAAEKANAAAKPGWPSVGDHWNYEARDSVHPDRKFTVTAEVLALTSSSVRDVVNAGGASVDWVHKPGALLIGVAPGVFEFSPYLRAFQEIRSGESWPKVELLRNPFCVRAVSCTATARVIGRERVVVKAGSFDAWKTEVELHWTAEMLAGPGAGRNASGTVTFSYWYVEGMRRPVRYQSRALGPSGLGEWSEPDIDMELVSYVPAASR